MNIYLLSTCLIWLVALLYLLLKRLPSPHITDNHFATAFADEKAGIIAERQHVPGDSPAYYTGDTSNDVLVVNELKLTPNPPRE